MPKDYVASFVMLPDMLPSMTYSDNTRYIIDFLARSSMQLPRAPVFVQHFENRLPDGLGPELGA